MKIIVVYVALSLFLLTKSHAQELDSVRYSGGFLFFHHYGKGETLIFLNGGSINQYSQLEEMAKETGKFYHVVLTEQRGTGRSIPTPFDSTTLNMKTAVDDIKSVLENQKLKQAIIVGHSWGSTLAMAFASQYPEMVKSLILICPGKFQKYDSTERIFANNLRCRLGEGELKLYDSLELKINQGTATAKDRAEWRRISRLRYVYSKTKFDSIANKINVTSYPKAWEFIRKDLFKQQDISLRLYRYKGPIEVICGRQDALAFNSYELKLFRPSVSLHWIEEAGHFPMYEQPKAFYSVLYAVLNKK